MRGIIKQRTVIMTVIVLVVAGTLVAIFSLAPEAVRLRAADGCFYLQGEIGQDSEVSANKRVDLAGPFSVVLGPIYEIDFDTDLLPSPFTLSLCVDPEWGPINELAIYAYDDELAAWRPMASVADPMDSTLTTEIRTPFSLWAVGKNQSFEVPTEHKAMMNELLAYPPAGTVGYRIYSSLALRDGDFVLIDDQVQRGGCSGVYFSGLEQSRSSVEKTTADGVYRLNAIWELGEGCLAGEELAAD